MKIIVFAATSPKRNNVLLAIGRSAKRHGLNCEIVYSFRYQACDVAVVWGLPKSKTVSRKLSKMKAGCRQEIFGHHQGQFIVLEAPVLAGGSVRGSSGPGSRGPSFRPAPHGPGCFCPKSSYRPIHSVTTALGSEVSRISKVSPSRSSVKGVGSFGKATRYARSPALSNCGAAHCRRWTSTWRYVAAG